LLVFARRVAPVQVSYLAYPNTTGLSAMDFRLTDGESDPVGMTEGHYTEMLVRLKRGFLCYRPADAAPKIQPEARKTPNGVTFGSFNNYGKVTGEMLNLWARILRATPGSRLVIKADGLSREQARADAEELTARHGIEESRFELAARIPAYREHLAAYHRIDIALDTFPYNGTTTTCEAMWMGVPVVTLAGKSHRSRVGASLLKQVGLEDLIGQTPQAYVAIAAELARDDTRRREIGRSLRERMAGSTLCDAADFTRHLEDAYRRMWEEWCAAR
jgi:protein O-GlcNAc transferase